ncbi:MAG: glutathione S-transferase family protein [Gaiellales bacterium]
MTARAPTPLTLFQITGSSSFAVRCALEEIGAPYEVVDILPSSRSEPASFAEVNPWRTVPALKEGDAEVYEIGACLLWLAERFPDAGLAPAVGDPARGAYLRWLVWLADTFRPLWERIMAPRFFTKTSEPGVREKGDADLVEVGAFLERELAGRSWCVGERYSMADIYLYMLVGWQHYKPGLVIGGDAVQAHYARVGARPAIARARDLDDLDERLIRYHPELRGGKPTVAPTVDL